ncbi:MAG: hypothetical protein A2048_01850 [Deltaproteobacteria bacterium GWA2_45_12]|nr:MAG: hypothetical protein A2048_01850 [Deltaproteobacteria bacterium GWA2_45_12]
MPHFPLFINLTQKNILIVGATTLAKDKIKRLLPFVKKITIVATRIDPEIHDMAQSAPLTIHQREWAMEDLKGMDMVIVAASEADLQKEIFSACTKKRILCNTVDVPKYCHFFFPALITRGDLSIGISTGGKAPAVSKKVKEYIDGMLPKNLDDAVSQLISLRTSLEPGIEQMKKVAEWTGKVLKEILK